jgi:hypothetical protein
MRLHPDERQEISALTKWEAVFTATRNQAHPLCGLIGVEHRGSRRRMPYSSNNDVSATSTGRQSIPILASFSGRSRCSAYLPQ